MKVVFKILDYSVDTTKKIYVCETCNNPFNWSDNSRWYGSWKKIEDDPKSCPIFCSEPCLNKWAAINNPKLTNCNKPLN